MDFPGKVTQQKDSVTWRSWSGKAPLLTLIAARETHSWSRLLLALGASGINSLRGVVPNGVTFRSFHRADTFLENKGTSVQLKVLKGQRSDWFGWSGWGEVDMGQKS